MVLNSILHHLMLLYNCWNAANKYISIGNDISIASLNYML